MLFQELTSKHFQYPNDKAEDAVKHSKISIEYAISVLEELKDGYQFMSADGVTGIPRKSITSKIIELKSLIK